MAREIVATYSIAACDLEAGQWGVATQSKFLAVGSVVPWAVPGVGAIATQAYANPRYGPQGLHLLAERLPAAEVVSGLSDSLVDLRVDDHPQPVAELTRLYAMHSLLFGKTPRDRWIDVDDALRAELSERLGRLGYGGELDRALGDWSGTENLEERVDG